MYDKLITITYMVGGFSQYFSIYYVVDLNNYIDFPGIICYGLCSQLSSSPLPIISSTSSTRLNDWQTTGGSNDSFIHTPDRDYPPESPQLTKSRRITREPRKSQLEDEVGIPPKEQGKKREMGCAVPSTLWVQIMCPKSRRGFTNWTFTIFISVLVNPRE